MGKIKVTQKDIDLIRVEAEAISSTDDKYYLIERLHKYIEAIDEQLEQSEGITEQNRKKDKMLELQEYAQEVRKYIMNRPVGPKRYGLFVEYPEGYDG